MRRQKMRYLNKIIFINSAHIPYAEIKLDGNVHFIGTQGVGKSTLLRAILFFYNVDKSKLGIKIQDKQKSYDEFYFPYPNSYIIYEVCRENGTFFVMTFSSNGRVAFRIVDCPYEKHFFVDKDNNVRHEWGRISEQIGTKVFRSNIIRGYEEFRDIIYGNIQNVSKELRRFSLMESSKYQNVPRTIQNIFLNQSLESRVIKDTIIDSMDFARDSIDLNFYREHIKNFRQQYEDIWKWYKQEKNGKVKVKTEAENVIDKYSLYNATLRTIRNLCAQFNYALDRDTARLPQIGETISGKSQELSRQKRLLGEEQGKYEKEREDLKGKEAVINDFLKQVKAKRQHYAEIDIDTIIERISRETELKIREKTLSQQESALTDENRNVKARYDALTLSLDNALKELRLESRERIYEIIRQRTEEISRLQDELSRQLDELNSRYQKKSDDIQENIDNAQKTKNGLKLREQKIAQFNPFREEMDSLSAQVREQEEKRQALTLDKSQKEQEISNITNETELKCRELTNDCEKELLKTEHNQDRIKQQIHSLECLLDRQKGSFIEWLDNNVSDWKDTIGKVVDDGMLYSTSLEPQKAVNPSDSLYGVRVELQNISKTINTPEEIRLQINALKQDLSSLDRKAAERKRKLEDDISESKRLPSQKLKALRMETVDIEAELRQIPAIIQKLNNKTVEYQTRLNEWREHETNSISEELNRTEEQLNKFKSSKKQIILQKESETKSLRTSFDSRKTKREKSAKLKIEEINNAIKQKEADTTTQKRELEAQMDAELKGLGVDVEKLSKIRLDLKKISDELKFIETHRPDYYNWQKDKREYFDAEPSKKEEKKLILDKLNELEHKFTIRREKKESEIRTLSSAIESMEKEKNGLEDAIGKSKRFLENTTCPAGITDTEAKETHEPLSDILDSLRDHISVQQQRLEDFKRAVTAFKSNFSPHNTFHFRTEFNTEEDYTEFASELHEFMSNQKIEEYRTRTSSQYANIIKRIAREVGDLNQHNADIKATINEINRDFRENNFAGVIKEIELRAVESSDRLMQQLLSIKKFDEEHGFDIGNLNLFSSEETLNRTNEAAVKLLMSLIDMMDADHKREKITLADTFKLEFKVKENDNDTNWVEKLSNVGSDGTDILVKSMVNIMLINVFKRKISRRFGDFKLHCMMDEIGKLHPDNVEGILKFANVRNIFLINSSPTTYNAQVYKYTYSLSKDEKSNTIVKTLLTIR